MRRLASLGLAAVLLCVTVPLGGATADEDPLVQLGQRVFVISMRGTTINELSWPDTPLLEAYAGEEMTFVVHVPARLSEPHTFHLHGHPWFSEDHGRFIDAVLLKPGETHTFTVTAGASEGFAGDWLYHCHMDLHFAGGMFGILRVYPYALDVSGPIDALDVSLSRMGAPVEDATFTATLDGAVVDVDVDEAGDGRYTVRPAIAAGASGELVVKAHHAVGESVARLDVTPGGAYTVVRNVVPDDAARHAGLQAALETVTGGAPETL